MPRIRSLRTGSDVDRPIHQRGLLIAILPISGQRAAIQAWDFERGIAITMS
jgi:hypothetical protein